MSDIDIGVLCDKFSVKTSGGKVTFARTFCVRGIIHVVHETITPDVGPIERKFGMKTWCDGGSCAGQTERFVLNYKTGVAEPCNTNFNAKVVPLLLRRVKPASNVIAMSLPYRSSGRPGVSKRVYPPPTADDEREDV